MSRRHGGWTGRTVTEARRQWAVRIARAVAAGQPLRCHRCGEPVTLNGVPWDVDHVQSRDDGGSVRDVNNQWVSHAPCNRRAGQLITMRKRAGRTTRLWRW